MQNDSYLNLQNPAQLMHQAGELRISHEIAQEKKWMCKLAIIASVALIALSLFHKNLTTIERNIFGGLSCAMLALSSWEYRSLSAALKIQQKQIDFINLNLATKPIAQ